MERNHAQSHWPVRCLRVRPFHLPVDVSHWMWSSVEPGSSVTNMQMTIVWAADGSRDAVKILSPYLEGLDGEEEV